MGALSLGLITRLLNLLSSLLTGFDIENKLRFLFNIQ